MFPDKLKNDHKPKRHPRRWFAFAALGMALLTGLGLYNALRPDPILYPQYPAESLVYTTGDERRRFSINLQTHEFGYIDEPAPEYRSPRVSPDGQWRVLWQPAEVKHEWDLILESVANNVPARNLGRFFHVGESPSWSADSQWLAFSAAPEKVNPAEMGWMEQELWLNNIETGELKRLTEDMQQQGGPSLSPDGTRLAYTANTCGSMCLYIMNLASGESEVVLYDQEHMVGDPSWWPSSSSPVWSPDGEWIAVVSHDPNDKYAVWLMRPDGSEARIVGGGGSYAADPEWRAE